jgi:divalent metal cation (Fe/Co/Zn/Cd) transporter
VAWNGWRMTRAAANELMDAAPGSAVVANVRMVAGKVTGVNAVEKCMVRKMGFEYFVDMHVEVDPDITVAAGHEIAHHVKDKVRAVVPHVADVLVHVEPSHPKGVSLRHP